MRGKVPLVVLIFLRTVPEAARLLGDMYTPKGTKCSCYYFLGSFSLSQQKAKGYFWSITNDFLKEGKVEEGWRGSVSVNTKIKPPVEDPRMSQKKTFFHEPNEGKVAFQR